MPTVLRVNQYTGSYKFLNKEGEIIEGSGEISEHDASVLMERIRQGYTYITPGCYVIRLDHTGFNDDELNELTDLVTFDDGEDGHPFPVTRELLTTEQWSYAESYPQSGSRIVVINDLTKSVKWLNNPIDEASFHTDPLRVPLVSHECAELNTILILAQRRVKNTSPEGVAPLLVRFK